MLRQSQDKLNISSSVSVPVSTLLIEGIEISGEGSLVDFSLGNDTSMIVSDQR